VIADERLLEAPVFPMKRNTFPMSVKNDTSINLDLSRAEGNILVDAETFDNVTLNPESTALLPSRDKYTLLKKSISRYYHFPVEGIVLGNGSDELIDNIARETKGSIALTLVPAFERLFEVGKKFHYDVSTYPLRQDEGYRYTDKFHKDFLTEIERLQPDIIWLCSPDNPTGALITPAHLCEIADSAKDARIVVDAAFADIVDETLIRQYGALVANRENLIILSSFSKSWGLAALRLGFVLASRNIAQALTYQSVMFNVNTLAVDMALHCLSNDKYRKKAFFDIRKSLTDIQLRISGLGRYELITNTPLNLFCIRHHTQRNLHKALLDLGVKTKSLDKMPGLEGEGFCRVLIPTEEIEKEALLGALSRIP
jgi:histidinol-phosphate aminotransferase